MNKRNPRVSRLLTRIIDLCFQYRKRNLESIFSAHGGQIFNSAIFGVSYVYLGYRLLLFVLLHEIFIEHLPSVIP
jgi:hypothetical protein